jgi:hypothetical protein
VKQPRKPPAEPEKILFRVEGKMSTFGGPLDFGMKPDEGLALFSKPDLEDPKYAYLFLPAPPPGTSGLGRRLNPNQFYFACRWNYSATPKEFLRRSLASVENPKNGRKVDARPVDWGPHERTGRVADLSPGLAAALRLNTDDVVRIAISARRAIPVKVARVKRGGHGSSNPHAKPASEHLSRAQIIRRAMEPGSTKSFCTAPRLRSPARWLSLRNQAAGRFPPIMSSIATATFIKW